jgi:hypothetical protein
MKIVDYLLILLASMLIVALIAAVWFLPAPVAKSILTLVFLFYITYSISQITDDNNLGM